MPRLPHAVLVILGSLLLAVSSSCTVDSFKGGRTPDPKRILDIRALDTDDDNKVVVRGLVVENLHGCELDVACILRLEVDGLETHVVYHYGEWPPCANVEAIRQGGEVSEGEWVEVYAEIDEGDELVTCNSSEYYILRLPND